MQLRGEDGSKVVALNKKGRYQRTDREAFKGGGEREMNTTLERHDRFV